MPPDKNHQFPTIGHDHSVIPSGLLTELFRVYSLFEAGILVDIRNNDMLREDPTSNPQTPNILNSTPTPQDEGQDDDFMSITGQDEPDFLTASGLEALEAVPTDQIEKTVSDYFADPESKEEVTNAE